MSRRYITEFTESAQRELRNIPKTEADKILDKLTQLQKAMTIGDTSNMDIKKLDPSKGVKWRIKIGNRYRAAYTIEDDEPGTTKIVIIAVGSRENFYNTV